jgi:hypothetical protein
MDFLDPKRKKSHRRRLLIGYILVAVAVAMGTLILLFSAFGYWVDRKTGDVIQNGTVFVDSQPGGSSVFVNGTLQGNKTAMRLVLPGGQQYTVKLTQDGYRDWTRIFSLDGGHIERLVYPLLVPSTLTTTESQLYATAPGLVSQSPDRHWLLVQQAGQIYSFDLFDLNNPKTNPVTFTIPSSIMTNLEKTGTIKVIEWSNDNKHVLLQHSFETGSEFLLIDTTAVASSVNVNTALTVAPSIARLRDKKPDQLYIYDTAGGVLRQADLKNRTVSGAILSNILDFKSYGSDLILYATKTGAIEGKTNIRIRENDKATYLLKVVPDGMTYALDVAEYEGTPYYVLGSSEDNAVFVYRDPLPTLKGQRQAALLISAVLRLTKPQFASFSTNTAFIAAQSANGLLVYDIESDRQFTLTLKHPLTAGEKLTWMDGFRFASVDSGQSYMMDFDGSNEQLLVPSIAGGPYFAPDYKTVFTLAPSQAVSGRFALTETSLTKR